MNHTTRAVDNIPKTFQKRSFLFNDNKNAFTVDSNMVRNTPLIINAKSSVSFGIGVDFCFIRFPEK